MKFYTAIKMYINRKKLSNKVIFALRSCSKCSFTPSKLRFFTLRKPKNPSCYTTSSKSGCPTSQVWTTTFIINNDF